MFLRALLLVLVVVQLSVVFAAPSHSMTRIQEVFRSLIPPENDIRGKKYFLEPLWTMGDDAGW